VIPDELIEDEGREEVDELDELCSMDDDGDDEVKLIELDNVVLNITEDELELDEDVELDIMEVELELDTGTASSLSVEFGVQGCIVETDGFKVELNIISTHCISRLPIDQLA